jgi:hypothetical protein
MLWCKLGWTFVQKEHIQLYSITYPTPFAAGELVQGLPDCWMLNTYVLVVSYAAWN